MKFVDTHACGFKLGLALGAFGRAAVHTHLLPSATWQQLQHWHGNPALQAMQQLTQQHFAWVWEEIEGLAQGLGLSVADTFLWNCRGDLWAMAPDGCTTVQLPTVDMHRAPPARLSHNEDGLPFFKPHVGIVKAQGPDGTAVASFAYPGSLLGHTFCVNDHGLGITVNNVRTRMAEAGVPRMVLSRALMGLPNAPAIAHVLRTLPRAGGFHLSVVQAGQPHITSIEYTMHRVSVQELQHPGFHANHLVHPAMREHPQLVTHSSGFRQERGHALLAAHAHHPSDIDPLAILADQQHPRFPIWRDAPDDSDHENTMATADMHAHADGIAWAVYSHPLQPPVLRLRNAQVLEGTSA